jgi:glucuronosyltransferase
LGLFHVPYHSHQSFQQSFMNELAKNNHDVTVVTTHLSESFHENIKVIHYEGSRKINREIVNQLEYYKNQNIINQTFSELNLYYNLIDQQLSQIEVQKLIKEGKKNDFDVVILECYFFCPLMAFAEIFDCPIIVLTSAEACAPIIDIVGGESNPVLHPDKTSFGFLHGKLTFFERLQTFVGYHGFHLIFRHFVDFTNHKLMRKHFPQLSNKQEVIEDRIALIFQNSLTTVKPLLLNMIELNFMHVYPPKPIPEGEVKSFLDSSQNGVVLMSLGSYARSKDLDTKVINTLSKVFASLHYEVLWKFEVNLHNKTDNVMTASWLPQADILAHPKLKLFITHGGLMSVQEAIDREVPMIIFPITYDQPSNANEMVDKGVACRLDLNTFTEESLRKAINEMMKPKYKAKICELRRLLNDQPMTSREKAIWYTEFVIRNKGAKHLAYPARKVPFYQRHHYDIILLILITVYLTVKAVKSIWNHFSQLRSMKQLVKEKKNV